MTTYKNLLPNSCRRRLLIKRSLRWWCACWTLTTAVCSGACALQYLSLRRGEETLKALEAEAAPLHELRRQTQRAARRLETLSNRESMLHALEKAGRPLKLLGIVSQSAAVNTGKMRITDLEMESTQERLTGAPLGQSAAASSRRFVDLRLEGVSSDNLSVARFVDVMRSFGVFDSVNLQSTDDHAEQQSHDFQLSCRYEE